MSSHPFIQMKPIETDDHYIEKRQQQFYNSLDQYQKGSYHIMRLQKHEFDLLYSRALGVTLNKNSHLCVGIRSTRDTIDDLLMAVNESITPDKFQRLGDCVTKQLLTYKDMVKELENGNNI